MLGPRDRAQRVLVAENPALLFSLLRTIKNAFGTPERCAGAKSSSPSRSGESGGAVGGRWTAPSVGTPGGVKPFLARGFKICAIGINLPKGSVAVFVYEYSLS